MAGSTTALRRKSDTRKRDMVSAVNRILKMGGVWGGACVFTADSLRGLIASIKPAAHGVSPKSFANIQSNLRAALRLAGIIDTAGGHRTKRDPQWSPLLEKISEGKALLGLSRFIKYCAEHSILPTTVNDDTVLGFHAWLLSRTIAIALLLIAPMRPQNLVALNWRHHVREFQGPRGVLTLLIPAAETKTRRSDLFYELDQMTSAMLRWNRKVLLPSIGADPDGDVFARQGGKRLSQAGLSVGITAAVEKYVGIKMTAHQFRHLAAFRYLEARPEDFETVRQLLGHSFGKTTLIYAGLSGERASRAYGEIVIAKMAASKKRPSKKVRRKRRSKADES